MKSSDKLTTLIMWRHQCQLHGILTKYLPHNRFWVFLGEKIWSLSYRLGSYSHKRSLLILGNLRQVLGEGTDPSQRRGMVFLNPLNTSWRAFCMPLSVPQMHAFKQLYFHQVHSFNQQTFIEHLPCSRHHAGHAKRGQAESLQLWNIQGSGVLS